jgi:hypothetical protein
MNSTDQEHENEQKKKLDELLLMIGGLEESIRSAIEQRDREFLAVLKPLKAKYYERLRRVAYGLPEERTVPAEKTS